MNKKTHVGIPDDKPADCVGLGEYVMKVLAEHGKESGEFKALIRLWGVDKLRGAYEDARRRKKGS